MVVIIKVFSEASAQLSERTVLAKDFNFVFRCEVASFFAHIACFAPKPCSLAEHRNFPISTEAEHNLTLPAGSTAVFRVQAIGDNPFLVGQPFQHEWHRTSDNAVVLSGPYELTLPNVQANESYYVIVSNANGSTTSATASLTISPCTDKTYTLTADFNKGYLLNLSTAIADELRISSPTKPIPYINVACSHHGTVARIDTATGAVIGEYRTAPDTVVNGRIDEPDPSRTTVDRFGNVWVANREDPSQVNPAPPNDNGSVTRIGILIGGIRCDRSGSPGNWTFTANPKGSYVRPPYIYNTCIDRDGDGAIKTSLGLKDILPWPNANGEDNAGGVSTAQDEAILNYVRVAGLGTRAIAIDQNNDVWVGGNNNHIHQKLDGTTGAILWTSPASGVGSITTGGYGGVINYVAATGERWLWTTTPDNAHQGLLPVFSRLKLSDHTILTMDPQYNYAGDYGMGVDPVTQQVWLSKGVGSTVARWFPDGSAPSGGDIFFGRSPIGVHKGMVIDPNSNVWIAHGDGLAASGLGLPDGSKTIGHLRTDGTWIGNVTLTSTANIEAGPTGVAFDNGQKVWVANREGNNAMRINPNAGPYSGANNQYRISAVDLTVELGSSVSPNPHPRGDALPYNYSDMTGYLVLSSTHPSGSWALIQDGGVAGKTWNKLTWTQNTPSGSGVTVECRAADTLAGLPGSGTTFNVFRSVTSGVVFSPPVTGRFLEVRVTIWRLPGTSLTPSLNDITVHCPTN